MSIERHDLRLDDGVKAPTKVLVCLNSFDANLPIRNNERRVSIGAALYGDRYETFRLSHAARTAYLEAVRTVRWFDEHLRCRMEPEAINHYDEMLGEAKL